MLDVFNIAQPQNCDIQIFYGFANSAPGTEARNWQTWNKPRGVSQIYMMLIGGGGDGSATDGGGSGAVTVWYGAAQHVPDSLALYIRGSNPSSWDTQVAYRSVSSVPVTLLTATSSAAVNGGSASGAGPFGASGFFTNTAGQDGATGAASASATTFLGAGSGSSAANTANYGYQNSTNSDGYFQLQPIIVGVGSSATNRAPIGCGASDGSSIGGPGMILIASW